MDRATEAADELALTSHVPANRRRYVVMGVAGVGKSLIGSRLASALGVAFADGDDFHSEANVAKMAAGIPLTDTDRAGWLAALAAVLADARRAHDGLVLACSALKRMYRDILRHGAPDLQLIFLTAPEPLVAARLETRTDHYMPPSLLASQLATLEPPTTDESPWICDTSESPDAIVARLVALARTA